MTLSMFWFMVGAFSGLFIGFMLGHLDGREMAHKLELRKLHGYTKRAKHILDQAQKLSGKVNER